MGNSKMVGVKDVHRELKKRGVHAEIFDPSSLEGDLLLKYQSASKQFESATANWTRRLTNIQLIKLDMYSLNKQWAAMLKSEGYTVLDMGDFHNLGFSVFYSMERRHLFLP